MKKIFTTVLLGLISVLIFGQTGPVSPGVIKTAIYFDVSPALSDMPPLSAEELKFMEERAMQKAKNKGLGDRVYPFANDFLPTGPDEVWQKEMGKNGGSKAPLVNFAGQSSPYYPPDCNGDVGPNHFFQTVNTTYAIYSKTGTQLVAPTAMNTLFSGVTGSGYNDGDPIILYDEHADRWMAAEFSISGSNDYMLIAVSTTGDPTGTWYRWSFDVDDMPDYMKFGVQRDGYYMSTNTYNGLNNAYVFQRDVMLAGGSSPQMVGFPNPWRPPGFHCIQPIDCDGGFPPIGTPGQFITINDNAIGGGNDELRIFELDVNWVTPASSTFNLVQQLSVTSFDSQFNAWGVGDITQPGTTQKLDAIPMVLMYRAQYRSFPSSQKIVCMHTVDVDATNHAGIRWYELQNTSGTWSIRQQGTYAPDSHSRWMGSIAINESHAIALGYTVSSSSVYPSIRYCGQSPAENANATGVLDITEESIQAGTTSQTSYNRWGDYSSMSVDPVNNNTFWYTSEYISSGGSRLTRIASFDLSDPPLTAEFSANSTSVCSGSSVNFTEASLGSPTTWSWSFPGGSPSSSSLQNPPAITYYSPGTYNVSLTVGDGITYDTETKTGYISVQNVIADFIGSPTTIVVGNTVTFTDNSSCSPTSWNWTFSGGTPSTATGPGPHVITYNNIGTYNASLTVSKASSNDTETKTGYINVINAVFNMTNATITTCSGNFYDPGGSSGSYSNNEDYIETFYPSTAGAQLEFNFTQFDVEYQSSCNYDYLNIYNGANTSAPLIGEYCGTNSPGTVTSSNAAGALTFEWHSDVSVTGTGWAASISCFGSIMPPVANFTANNTNPYVGSTVAFTDQSTNNPTSWSWSFNPATVTYVGGTASNSQNPQVQFNAAGYYTVTLTATNSAGSDGETKTNYILAANPPVANFMVNNVNPAIGQSVFFTDLSTGNPTSWQWTFEGGVPSSWNGQFPPAIQYNNTGTWDVTLEVSNGTATDIELKTDYITVTDLSTSTATLSLPNVSVGAPGEIAVPLHLDAISSNLVVGIQISFYYNETYVNWMGTSTTPENGISYINPSLTPLGGDWLWNSLPGNLIFIWIDPALSGVPISPGDLLVFRFNYLGGLTVGQSTPLTFSLTKTYADGTEEKIVNELTDENYQPYSLTFVNGTIINEGIKTVNLKVLLEGPYNGTDMTSKLVGVLPLSQPFNESPWNYPGNESVTQIPADAIDWILLELRDATDASSATPATAIERQAAFVLSDGSVVGMDGTSQPELTTNVTQNLFVVVHQQNHLSIMSSNGLTENAGEYTYDYSTGSGQAYGGILAQKEISPGVWGMFSGDGNRNGTVDTGDESPTWETEAGTTGYLPSDYNLDSESNNIDKDDFWAPNLGKGTQVPN
ncbi:MAG: PKD domain-containing protein [Bacteroidales bacterium]